MQTLIIDKTPPSVNQCYRRNPHTRGMYMTKAGKEYKRYVSWLIARDKLKKTNGGVRIDIELCFKDKRRRDIDNYNKILLDSISNIIIEDDSNIFELNIKKKIGCGFDSVTLNIYKL